MRFFIYELLILCSVFLEICCYEKCTHGIFYYYCNIGKCCKRDGTWFCELYSATNCESTAVTTTTRTTSHWFPTKTTTKSPYTFRPTTRRPFKTSTASENIVLPIVGIVSGILVVFFIVVCVCRNVKKNKSPGVPTSVTQPANQSPRSNIYFTTGDRHIYAPGYNIPQPGTQFSSTHVNSLGYPPSAGANISPQPWTNVVLKDNVGPPPAYDSIDTNVETNVEKK